MQHQRDHVNAHLQRLHHQHQLPPMSHPAAVPYLVPPDVDNELLSLFMVASSEDDPGFQWTVGAGMQPPATSSIKAPCSTRLARKAELARASRLRKKQYIGDLEERVRHLKEAVADAQERVRRAAVALRIPSAAGQQLRSAQYLDLAKQCTAPSIPVKFAIWSLDQPDEFYGQPGLWQSLLEGEIGLDAVQLRALRQRQMPMRSLRQSMAQVKALGERVRSECHRVEELIADESMQFEQMLTLNQADALHQWVAANEFVVDIAKPPPVR